MKSSKSLITGWICAGFVIIAFFLPWARFNPDHSGNNLLGIARSLGQDKSDFTHSYLLMRGEDFEALWNSPADGISAYQLLALSHPHHLAAKIKRAVFDTLVDNDKGSWQIYGLILAPLLALAGAILLSSSRYARTWMLAVAFGQLGFYTFVRWKLQANLVNRLAMQIDLNWGLWLSLYGLLCLALLLLIRALLPDKVRF